MAFVAAPASEPLSHLGCLDSQTLGRIEITDTLSRELLTPLLHELRAEPCAHSWQPKLAKVPSAAAFDRFMQLIGDEPPGRVFTYFRETPSGREALALGVVSDRISRGFPFEGLPVARRAFVHPAYRCHALYSMTLAHRLDYCRQHWGNHLWAVHLGTASPGIERVFRRLHKGRVLYLGKEDLGDAGQVRALLGVTDAFERGCQDEVLSDRDLGLYREAQGQVLGFLRGADTGGVRAIAGALERLAGSQTAFGVLHHFIGQLPGLR